MDKNNTAQNPYQACIPPINDLLAEYLQELEILGRSQKTITWYHDILVKFFASIGSHSATESVANIGKPELKVYILHLQQRVRWPNNKHIHDEKHMSPFSIAGHVRAIKAFWSWLAKQEYIDQNPFDKFPVPKTPQHIIKTLDAKDIRKLLNAVDRTNPVGERFYGVLLLLIDTGARISEVVGIKLSDINLAQSTVKITGKGKKDREVPYSNMTRKTLLKYINDARKSLCAAVDSEYLFPGRYGDHTSIGSMQQALRRLAEKTGMDKCYPHLLRHTFGTLFIANNGSSMILQQIMGHASLQTTEKYVHLKTEDLKKQHKLYSPMKDIFKEP